MKINLFYTLILILSLYGRVGICQVIEIGSPKIYNIPPQEYGYESQNFSIIQDDKGMLYIGNLSGILQSDGSDWNLIEVTGAPALCKDHNETIFVGGFNEFGFLKKDDFGNVQFSSLVSKLPEKDKYFGVVGDVISAQEKVFFYTKTQVFQWDYKNLKVIEESNSFLRLFKVNNLLYAYKSGIGLMEYSNGVFTLMVDGDYFSSKKIIDILPYASGLMIKVENEKGFYIYKNNIISKMHSYADDFIKENNYTHGIRLSDGNYAIGTSRCGVVIISPEGEVLYTIGQASGLYDDQIKYLYVDNSNNLWMATNNGLAKVEVPDEFTYFYKTSGLQGGAKTITRHNGILYVATTLGLFYLIPEEHRIPSCSHRQNFAPVPEVHADANNFFVIDEQLYLCTDIGLYKINNKSAELIEEGLFECFLKSETDSNIYFCAKGSGLEAYSYENKKLSKIGQLKNINSHIRTLAQDKNGNLWLGTNYQGVYQVMLPKGWNEKAEYYHFDEGYGLPENFDWLDVYNSSKGILFSTAKGIYRYNSKIRRFYVDTLIGIDFKDNNYWVYPLTEDNEHNLWFSSGIKNLFDKQTCFAKSTKEGYSLNTEVFSKIKNYTIENIFVDTNNIVWFATFDGIIRFDKSLMKKTPDLPTVHFRKISVNGDSLLQIPELTYEQNQEDSLIPRLPFNLNTISFRFSSTNYNDLGKTEYSYRLEGFDKEWAEWSEINKHDYINLPEGFYTFWVKAKDNLGKVSESSAYSFEILPPFYRSLWAYGIYFILLITFMIMVIKWRNYLFEKEKHNLERIIADRTEELVRQKERAEQLVSNILPKQTAEELKTGGRSNRKKYKMATVLFSSIRGFGDISEEVHPEELLDELDKYFHHFDTVVEKLNIEKVRTIGDTYMCAGGIPEKNRTNPIDVVMAALEMRNHLETINKASKTNWSIRIGIHSGPVIAGVVGTKKISFDIWGDTVNIASRMEATGEVGQVNISDVTHEMVHQYFDCELKGKIPVKYKGDIGLYIVKGLKPEYSIENSNVIPNKNFITKLQMIRFDDLEELVMTKLDKGLPKNLYYHNLKHTIDVLNMVEVIGRKENVSEEEMLLLKTAALFHDAGFLIGYDEHELLGIKLAGEILPDYGYTESQIQTISELVYATKLPPNPKNLLEEIMCDADLDYLGRTDFIPVSQNLFRELYEHDKIKTIEDWNKLQVKFISSHKYFTETGRELREVNKQKQLEKIKAMV